MYHAASVPHLAQPSAEQSEYVYQAAPPARPYTAFAPMQYNYGPMYGYAPGPNGPVQLQPMQPGTYPGAPPTQQFYPMAASDYPMQFYAPMPMYAPAQFLSSNYNIAPAAPSFGYHQQQQQGQTDMTKHLAPLRNSDNPKTPPQTAGGSRQVGSPMHTSTPLRGSSMDAGNPRQQQQQFQNSILWRQQQTPSARLRQSRNAAARGGGGRQAMPSSDNLISCIFPSDEDLPANRYPVVRRARDTTASSGELLTSTRLHNNSSPSFLYQQYPASWRVFPKQSKQMQMQDLEDRVHSLKMQDGPRKGLNGHSKHGMQDIPLVIENAFRKPLPAAAQNLKYKTKFCRNEEDSGTCPYGARCLFLHRHEVDVMDEVRTQLNGDKADVNGVEQKRRRGTKGPAELQLNPAEVMGGNRKCNISRFRLDYHHFP
ncbi:hypothetical protein WR25_18317 isoform B [Diploscapter pachys]|uniref:C3H1-type domain-containing protein n=1 Tax=Diploscapter pachys TaxID=2018661 RepID=A0A2A2L0E3_9BILA|nr:hypothetical protein WR25_18317 isoform B [Diploscapter pachys]